MKRTAFIIIVAALFLTACSPAAPSVADSPAQAALLVTAGENQKSFSAKDLQALPAKESTFRDVIYKGVSVAALIEAAGMKPEEVKAVKAVAADGYSVNYDLPQILKDNVVVAYGLADGSTLSADDGSFRMVLPDEEGKLNLRMLAELKFIK